MASENYALPVGTDACETPVRPLCGCSNDILHAETLQLSAGAGTRSFSYIGMRNGKRSCRVGRKSDPAGALSEFYEKPGFGELTAKH